MKLEEAVNHIVSPYIGKPVNVASMNFMADDIRKLLIAANSHHLIVAVRGPTDKEIRKAQRKGLPHPNVQVWIGQVEDPHRPAWADEPDTVIRGSS